MKKGWRIFLIAAVISAGTSCAYDNPLTVKSDTPSVVVFYGTVEDNEGEEISGPGFVYGPVTLKWTGDKTLNLISLSIDFPAAGKFSGDYNCNFDGDLLEEAFTTMTDRQMKPGVPYKSSGSFVCSGIAAANEDDNFIATGTTKVRGFTGGVTDQKFYKGDTKLFFYYFPENDD